ncbi:MAG TPA: hypothetical protein VGE07_05665 [Herpetosiphonaceae bacterium]
MAILLALLAASPALACSYKIVKTITVTCVPKRALALAPAGQTAELRFVSQDWEEPAAAARRVWDGAVAGCAEPPLADQPAIEQLLGQRMREQDFFVGSDLYLSEESFDGMVAASLAGDGCHAIKSEPVGAWHLAYDALRDYCVLESFGGGGMCPSAVVSSGAYLNHLLTDPATRGASFAILTLAGLLLGFVLAALNRAGHLWLFILPSRFTVAMPMLAFVFYVLVGPLSLGLVPYVRIGDASGPDRVLFLWAIGILVGGVLLLFARRWVTPLITAGQLVVVLGLVGLGLLTNPSFYWGYVLPRVAAWYALACAAQYAAIRLGSPAARHDAVPEPPTPTG